MKINKDFAHYTPHAEKHAERCEVCRHFRALHNRCAKVQGEISPQGWCRLFEAKHAENA